MEAPKTLVQVGVGIVLSSDRKSLLVCQRRHNDYYGGYWEFPGGKCEPGEAPKDCIVRELAEELGIVVQPTDPLDLHYFFYADRNRQVELHPWFCRLIDGQPQALEVEQFAWHHPAELSQLNFLPANGPLIAEINRRLGF